MAELARRVIAVPQIEGVTLLGGEPFDQAPAAGEFARRMRAAKLSVMTFTGYRIEELRGSKRPGVATLLKETDLLVDGPYRAESPEVGRPWVGSSNQRFHFLTSRYAHLSSALGSLPNRVEIRIAADGTTNVNGMAEKAQLNAFRRAVSGVSHERLTRGGTRA